MADDSLLALKDVRPGSSGGTGPWGPRVLCPASHARLGGPAGAVSPRPSPGPALRGNRCTCRGPVPGGGLQVRQGPWAGPVEPPAPAPGTQSRMGLGPPAPPPAPGNRLHTTRLEGQAQCTLTPCDLQERAGSTLLGTPSDARAFLLSHTQSGSPCSKPGSAFGRSDQVFPTT